MRLPGGHIKGGFDRVDL